MSQRTYPHLADRLLNTPLLLHPQKLDAIIAGLGQRLLGVDGIQIDDNMHALDHDFKAIPGLYVIGDMSGNYFSGSYPCLMAGAAAGRSATFGRLAGQNAAAGI